MHFRLLSICIIFISFVSCIKPVDTNEPLAKNGIIDLHGVDIDSSKVVKLDGEWEVYWNTFLFIDNDSVGITPEYVETPGSWVNNSSHDSCEFSTFRLLLKGLVPDTIYSLNIPVITTNYKLWVDKKLRARSALSEEHSKERISEPLTSVVFFYADDSDAEIVIHVSSYDYRLKGINKSITLGSTDSIRLEIMKRLILEVFIVGLLSSLAFFHLRICIYRKEDNTDFYFALICISSVLLILTTGEQILTVIAPGIPWTVLWRLELVAFYFPPPMIIILVSVIFPKEVNRGINKAFLVLAIISCLSFILMPMDLIVNVLIYAQGVIILFLIYLFYILICAIIHKRLNAIVHTVTAFGISLATLNYILTSNNVLNFTYLSYIGFLILLLSESSTLISRFARSIKQREILTKSRDKFEIASNTDGLTGLYNVRYLNKILGELIDGSILNGSTLSVIMIDVDNFKQYNDTYGHKKGDIVLKELASIITTSAREVDVPCRYGGEEFTIALPGGTLSVAGVVAERIRLKFEALGYSTISAGVSEYIPGENGDQVIERADMALYKAKNSGKNRIVLD